MREQNLHRTVIAKLPLTYARYNNNPEAWDVMDASLNIQKYLRSLNRSWQAAREI